MSNVACPYCGSEIVADLAIAGKLVACPACSGHFTMPAVATLAAAAGVPPVTPVARAAGIVAAAEPGKVQAIRIMAIVGAVFAGIFALGMISTCFLLLYPGTYLALTTSILALVNAIQMSSTRPMPKYVPILQIICVINFDFTNLILGIIELVFLDAPEVKAYWDAP